MDCFGTYFTHVQTCNVTRIQVLRNAWTSSSLEAPFKLPSSWRLQTPFKPFKPLRSPLQRWRLEASLKPPSSPLEAPFKPSWSPLETPLKPPWSPLEAFRRWSPLRPSDLPPPPRPQTLQAPLKGASEGGTSEPAPSALPCDHYCNLQMNMCWLLSAPWCWRLGKGDQWSLWCW